MSSRRGPGNKETCHRLSITQCIPGSSVCAVNVQGNKWTCPEGRIGVAASVDEVNTPFMLIAVLL